MDLILQKDIKNLGKAGDRVRVRPGYARNYLLPKKLALVLNENRLGEWKHRQKITEARKKKALLERESLLKKLSAVHLIFKREGQAGGRLFGSISPADISRELEQKHRLPVDKRDIAPELLKTVGEHRVKISLDPKRQTEIKVTVQKILSEKDKRAAGKKPVPETSDRKEAQKSKEVLKKDAPPEESENPAKTAVREPPADEIAAAEEKSLSAGEALKKPSAEPNDKKPSPEKKLSPAELSGEAPSDPDRKASSMEKPAGKPPSGERSET